MNIMVQWRKFLKQIRDKKSQILLQVLIVGGLVTILTIGFSGWAVSNLRLARQTLIRERAVQAAEAGVDYYRWHLAHAAQDFQDGTGVPGPYTHIVRDKDGNEIGKFVLTITPPPIGSTVVTVRSTGSVNEDSTVERTVETKLAKPSIAKYAVVANDVMRFGAGTEITGPVHSNNGIRFDGLAHNLVTSAVATYDDPDHGGGQEFGVHTHVAPVDPFPPALVPARPGVFQVGRQFPVPTVDFVGLTADLAQMKADAQANGYYRPSAGALGYHVVLKVNDTFDLYRVTGLINAPPGCTNIMNVSGWGTWSIRNENFIGNFPLPANGIIFLEDDVFVNGQVDTARVTIAAAFFPDNPPFRKNIIVNQDLRYTNYDGRDVVALIAQGNVHIGMVSGDSVRIDGALVAQTGRVGRFHYRPPGGGSNRCAPYHIRNTVTLLGMIGTNQRYGFAWTDGTGYQIRNLNYDGNLRYNPPPSFPLTSDQYETISWDEIE